MTTGDPGDVEVQVAADVDRVVLYRDREGKIRWRYRAAGNGEILGDSGQGYADRSDAVKGAERVTGRSVVVPGVETKSLTATQVRLVDLT